MIFSPSLGTSLSNIKIYRPTTNTDNKEKRKPSSSSQKLVAKEEGSS